MSELESLYQVQQLDTRIFELRGRLEDNPLKEELERLRGEEAECAEELSRVEEALEKSSRKQAALEDEIRSLDQKLSREEGKLYGGQVTNPKELRGLQAEVRSLKRKKDELETELLEEMEGQDGVRARLEELRSKDRELLALIEEKSALLERETGETASELAELEREREKWSSGVGEELMRLYEKLLAAKQNLAVVKVIEGVCQGCRVELPGKEYDRFLRTEGVFRCSNCGRILVR
ncbi:C4-type zinc ribbon domain-containing protein [Candidatus Solincola tengchongensis]|uniref:zinc ribbon domain-containing protein n=1 Tax=Candidatus Solincola tengchongensis TaxID=2900693 RepID=UPI00257DFFE5|nr:C4-type zinc ribbon domain-containing protein [Candidatus Solincola tengchongensis]